MRIQWAKMHKRNYDGSCEHCGGKCTDEASINEWARVHELTTYAEIAYAHKNTPENRQRVQYLHRQIATRQNYTFS